MPSTKKRDNSKKKKNGSGSINPLPETRNMQQGIEQGNYSNSMEHLPEATSVLNASDSIIDMRLGTGEHVTSPKV